MKVEEERKKYINGFYATHDENLLWLFALTGIYIYMLFVLPYKHFTLMDKRDGNSSL